MVGSDAPCDGAMEKFQQINIQHKNEQQKTKQLEK